MRAILRLLCIALLAVSVNGVHALELPHVFSDGMVLQRDQPIVVWGRADAAARIEVAIDGDRAGAIADADGMWRVELPARAAGGPFTMRIDDGDARRELRDVLVGEVWLASGQSNMEWPIAQSADAESEIARATDPLVRHFKVPKAWAGEPQWQLAGGEWVASSPEVAAEFSAVAHFFARELRDSTGVPIGIVDSTWGGSRIEAWMDAGSQGLDPQQIAARAAALHASDAASLVETRQNLARFPGLPADDEGWQSTDLDDGAWVTIMVPSNWEAAGWNGMDGVAWYRTTFTLDAEEAGSNVLLGVGRIDDSDETWVNGVAVGSSHMQYNAPRRYTVPASALRVGVNHVAVRVTDTGGGGGIHGPIDELFVQPHGRVARALGGAWKFRPAQVTVALLDDKNQHPALLYNAMVHPLQPFALRGVIWYQGEANAGTAEDALRYRAQFPAMIAQWRMQWHAPVLPFLWVQLASFGSGLDRGAQSPWAVLRESQSSTLSLPATAQAVAIDIGDPTDIHPRNKQEVGKRLALAARHVAYRETLVHAGPVFAGTTFDGDAATVAFDVENGALAVRGGGEAVQGFALAGADRVFHAADATLNGDNVTVRSPRVATPLAARYAWSDDPSDANLVNDAGLPASPFRSDDW